MDSKFKESFFNPIFPIRNFLTPGSQLRSLEETFPLSLLLNHLLKYCYTMFSESLADEEGVSLKASQFLTQYAFVKCPPGGPCCIDY